MRKYFVITILFDLITVISNAQFKTPFLKLHAVSVGFGVVDAGNQSLNFDQLMDLAKNSASFTSIDLSTYHQGKYQFEIVDNDAVVFQASSGAVDNQKIITHSRFDVRALFNKYNKSKDEYSKHLEVRIGLFYQPYEYQQANYVRTDQITADSSIYNYVYYDAWTPLLGLDGAILYRTDPEKWYSLYAGVGIGLGFSINPKVAETFGTMTSKATSDTTSGVAYPVYNFLGISNSQNIYPGKSSLLIEGQFPVGVTFQLYNAFYVFFEGDIIASKQFFTHDGALNEGVALAGAAGLRLKLD